MSAESLELINIRRQLEKQNLILKFIIEELRRLNENYERIHKLECDESDSVLGKKE